MKRLSNRQEQVMAIIWANEPMTVSKLIPMIDEHLHFNTISTVVRKLDRIGFLCHDSEFRPFVYYAKISKDEYITELIESITDRFFDSDMKKLAETIGDKTPPREALASLGGIGLESVGYSHVVGVTVVEFEHRHCFLVCQ